MSEKIVWSKGSAEEKVTKFYAHGVENFGDFHGGYLNFGFWENGNKDYLKAAETLVLKLGHLLQLEEGAKLLDVACGMGGQDVLLAQNFPLEQIIAFDLLPQHLEHAKRRIDYADLSSKVLLKQGTATELPFEENSFTHVLCIEGIVHFHTREKFFRECHKVLAPGGRVVFADYAVRKAPKNKFERGLLKLVSKVWNIPYENVDSPEQYQTKLERSGFQAVKVHCVGENVIPGYCEEQSRAECIAELVRIRGWFAGRIGHIIDVVLEWAYRKGLIEYILVEAQVLKETPWK